jgi:uncharacterized protein YjbI with pentapeptide repeats
MTDSFILNSSERGLMLTFSGSPSPKTRIVRICGCQVIFAQTDAVKICAADPLLALNLAIEMKKCRLVKNEGHGCHLQNLTLTSCDIQACEFNENQLTNLVVEQVRSIVDAKYSVNLSDCQLTKSELGSGLQLIDSGVHL